MYFRLQAAFTQTLLHVWSIEEKKLEKEKMRDLGLTVWHFNDYMTESTKLIK